MATGSIQTSPPPPPLPLPPPEYTSPPITIILTVILLVFFFIGFFSIYFCKCFMQNILYAWHLRHSPTGTPVGGAASSSAPGLDPMIIKSFPSFSYSSVKDYRREKYGLECAICLVEFEDSDMLRLLTPCCHVFHQECIDLWLESHTTCPVCRRNLDSPLIQSPAKSPLHANNNMHDAISAENESVEDCFSITIKEDNEEETRVHDKGEKIGSTNDDEAQNVKVQNFYRSHSTGHSLVINKEEKEDKYTLRLPEHVKSNIIKGHNSSRSWTTFGDYKPKVNTGRSILAENSV